MRDPLLSSLGERVRELRAKAGMSLKDLAGRSSLSLRFLNTVEAGEGNISVLKLQALARALGSTPQALLEPREDRPVLALLGIRGAGKTTVGRKLARRLRLPFLELDRRIEESSGLALPEIFALHGENYYRRLERESLDEVLSLGRPLVLATGGGIVNASDTYDRLLSKALTVWLRASPEDHWNRVVQQGDKRPMAENPLAMAELRRLVAAREPLYLKASRVVDTSGIDADAVVENVLGFLAAEGPGRQG
jgi:XRE family aerobic/anaerobic benzoate catabolism transcriptional regulator